MTTSTPIRDLRTNLETARIQAVKALAESAGELPIDALQRLAIIQGALTAVREEIESHEVKVGGGGELPLR